MTSLSKNTIRAVECETSLAEDTVSAGSGDAGGQEPVKTEADSRAETIDAVGRKHRRFSVGDVVGGMAGMTVALPQAMGLGITLFAAMGLDASSGALAGLIGVAAISLASGIGGNTGGMISAPNGPVVIFLIGALVSVAGTGVAPADLPTALAVLVVLAGLFQLGLAMSGGGQLIKFIPYPVVSGLVTAIGVLMIASQLPSLFGGSEGAAELMGILGSLLIGMQDSGAAGLAGHLPRVAWLSVPAMATVVTLIGIRTIPLRLPGVPPIIGGFVVGMVLFHGAMAVIPGPVPQP